MLDHTKRAGCDLLRSLVHHCGYDTVQWSQWSVWLMTWPDEVAVESPWGSGHLWQTTSFLPLNCPTEKRASQHFKLGQIKYCLSMLQILQILAPHCLQAQSFWQICACNKLFLALSAYHPISSKLFVALASLSNNQKKLCSTRKLATYSIASSWFQSKTNFFLQINNYDPQKFSPRPTKYFTPKKHWPSKNFDPKY